jgi:hypothetical protein
MKTPFDVDEEIDNEKSVRTRKSMNYEPYGEPCSTEELAVVCPVLEFIVVSHHMV